MRLQKVLTDFKSDKGQGTIEFAIVTAALLLIVIALGALWKLGDQGIFVEHAINSATKHIGDLFCC